VEELLRSFVVALDVVIEDEKNTIAQVSSEEWDAISPTKYKRRSVLLDLMNVRIYIQYNVCSFAVNIWQ
jgi:hypothetical protein